MTLSLAGILYLVIGLIVLGAVYALVAYIVRTLPIADPLGRIVLVVTMVICVIVAILMLLNFAGVGTPITVTS